MVTYRSSQVKCVIVLAFIKNQIKPSIHSMRLTLFLLFISSFCFAQKEEIIGEKPVLNPPCEGFRESTLFDGTPAIIRDCETGEDYSVATSLQELNTKTLALSLKNQNLTTFPAEIFRYPQLRVLDLSGNSIASIPP